MFHPLRPSVTVLDLLHARKISLSEQSSCSFVLLAIRTTSLTFVSSVRKSASPARGGQMRRRSFDVTRVERPCAVPSLEGRLGWVLILSLSPSPYLPLLGRETLRRSIVAPVAANRLRRCINCLLILHIYILMG